MARFPKALFLSHGGGPLPLLGDPGHDEMVSCLQEITTRFPKPDAIALVSAHWEESAPTVTSGKSPPLIYDYYGFPEESYDIQYPCTGSPALAEEVRGRLEGAGINCRADDQRGFDHGLFVPLKIMYPNADIPCIQLSLTSSLDPALHVNTGKALKSLGQQNVLLVGSGFSFHNLRAFFAKDATEAQQLNQSFEDWLLDTCCNADYSETDREQRLVNWADAPGARYCHPREEHLLPLHVCYGAAQSPCDNRFELMIMGRKTSMYLW